MSESTTEAAVEPTEPQDTTQGEPADEPLGEGGKKALQAERDRAKELEKRLSEATSKLTEIERANESALEKAQREAKEAQEAASKASADAARFRVAAKHGISDEDADLFLTGTDADTLEKQAARLVERNPIWPMPDPTQGGKGAPAGGSTADQFAAAVKDALS